MDCLSLISDILDFFIFPKWKNVLSQKIQNSFYDTKKKKH